MGCEVVFASNFSRRLAYVLTSLHAHAAGKLIFLQFQHRFRYKSKHLFLPLSKTSGLNLKVNVQFTLQDNQLDAALNEEISVATQDIGFSKVFLAHRFSTKLHRR